MGAIRALLELPAKTPSVRKSELGVRRTPAVALLLGIVKGMAGELSSGFGRLQANHTLLDGDEKYRRLYLCRRLTTCPVRGQPGHWQIPKSSAALSVHWLSSRVGRSLKA
jgi:hypothetical protein